MPEIDALYEQTRDRADVRVFAVGTGTPERVAGLRAERAPHVPMPRASEAWTNAIGVTAFPETLIVDPHGRVAERIAGGTDAEYLSERIDALLAEAAGAVIVDPQRGPPQLDRHGFAARVIYQTEGVVRRAPLAERIHATVRAHGDGLTATLHLPRTAHTYADQLVYTVDGVEVAPKLRPGTPESDDVFGLRQRYDRTVRAQLPSGAHVDFRWQACLHDVCLAPRTEVFDL